MKNKKLALLLAAASLHSNLSAKDCSTDVSNQVATKKYIDQQDKETLDNSKERTHKSNNSNFMWKILRIGGKVLKWTFTAVGGYSLIQNSDNYYNSKAKNEYLSLVEKYKALPYNERFNKFLEISEDLILKHEKTNDKYKDKKEKMPNYVDDQRTKDYIIDKFILVKHKDDMNNVPFGRLKDGKPIVCADFTYILASLAQELGLICYNLIMKNSKKKDSHSVLMIAQKKENSCDERKFNWFTLDGRNYLLIRELLEKHNIKYPNIYFAKMVKLYKLDILGYDKMYVVKNNNCIFIRNFDAKNEIVAELNDKLIDSLNNGYDVNWTDDSYVKCFEQIEKDKS